MFIRREFPICSLGFRNVYEVKKKSVAVCRKQGLIEGGTWVGKAESARANCVYWKSPSDLVAHSDWQITL